MQLMLDFVEILCRCSELASSERASQHYEDLVVGSFISIEGVVVCPRGPSDGGSIDHSLHVDATTVITEARRFDVCLVFVPKLSIRSFLSKTTPNPSFKSTVAFVIIQVDRVEKSKGGVNNLRLQMGHLHLIVQLSCLLTRGRVLTTNLLMSFKKAVSFLTLLGMLVFGVATLSILDITLIDPLFGEKKKKELLDAFHLQISNMGYGKEIFGEFHVTSYNGALLVKKCKQCKSFNVATLTEGGFCYSCGNTIDVEEAIKLVGDIVRGTTSTEVTLIGDAVDKVLQFEDTVINLYKKDAIKNHFE